MDEQVFSFFGEEGDLAKIGWCGEEKPALWRYNQHYFDDLTSSNAAKHEVGHRAILEKWYQDNPKGTGIGWDPYPTSLRVVNWIKYSLSGGELTPLLLASLGNQIEWLSDRIERHLLGNHILANAKALYFGGCFFSGDKPGLWLKKARAIFEAQFREQVLRDGGHFELSPMYHSVILEDLLDLINIARAYGYEEDTRYWEEISYKMFGWLECMCHPDGRFSFFNDAAFGVAAEKNELLLYAARLGLPEVEQANKSRYLAESGYVRLENQSAVLVCDIGNVGPDYIPGHAHADTLSFEMSVYGHRLFVNSGTSEYGVSAERSRQRETRAHNTVSVNGQDSSEVWGGFRVGRRARPLYPKVCIDSEVQEVVCSHDGFGTRLRPYIHRRAWLLSRDSLVIKDEVSGSPNSCESFFYCHPDIKVLDEGGLLKLTLPDQRSIFMEVVGGNAMVARSSWHPSFGASLSSHMIHIEFESNESQVTLKF
ncbi:heparinase II/III family protein [Luminiphilus sp.]|nr:heparinase II/III family protein [Luminiphilus sp.]